MDRHKYYEAIKNQGISDKELTRYHLERVRDLKKTLDRAVEENNTSKQTYTLGKLAYEIDNYYNLLNMVISNPKDDNGSPPVVIK